MKAEVLRNSNRCGRINAFSIGFFTRLHLLENGYAMDAGDGYMQLTESGKAWCGLEGRR